MIDNLNSVTKGKRSELYMMGMLLENGFTVYQALADTEGIDCVVLGKSNKLYPVQIKSREDFVGGDLISIETLVNNMFIIVYDVQTKKYWILPSNIYRKLSRQRALKDGTMQYRLNYTKKNSNIMKKYEKESGVNFLRSKVYPVIP